MVSADPSRRCRRPTSLAPWGGCARGVEVSADGVYNRGPSCAAAVPRCGRRWLGAGRYGPRRSILTWPSAACKPLCPSADLRQHSSMRRLYYAGGDILIDDAVSKALLRFARALAENSTSDIVSVPVRSETGSTTNAHLLLGPSSQLFSVPVAEAAELPPDTELILDLEDRTARLRPSTPAWPDEMTDVSDIDIDAQWEMPRIE